MMRAEPSDPMMRRLAALSAPIPSSVRAEQVRMRCRRVLDERRRQRTPPKGRSAMDRVFDATCFLVVGIYLAGAIGEAVKLLN